MLHLTSRPTGSHTNQCCSGELPYLDLLFGLHTWHHFLLSFQDNFLYHEGATWVTSICSLGNNFLICSDQFQFCLPIICRIWGVCSRAVVTPKLAGCELNPSCCQSRRYPAKVYWYNFQNSLWFSFANNYTIGSNPGVQHYRQETWVPSLGWEAALEAGMATHSSILAWTIPWTEEPGGVQSMGLQSWTRLSDFHFLFFFHSIKYENFNSVWKVEKVEFLQVRKSYRWMIKTHRVQISYFWTTWSLLQSSPWSSCFSLKIPVGFFIPFHLSPSILPHPLPFPHSSWGFWI